MADITIVKLNQTYMKVMCSEIYMELDIQDRFSFKVADAKYDPRVRKGHWDGIKRLYNRQTKKLYIGLLYELIKLMDKKDWTYSIDPELLPSDEQLDDDDIQGLVEFIRPHDNGQPIEPYDYQLEAVKYMLNMDRSVSLAATSAGKSLMLYLAARSYQLMDELHGRYIFITVPSISLVEQLYNDFQNYSTFDGSEWHVNQHCQRVSSKYPKNLSKQIIITTWQSMAKLPYDEFENIGAIFIDECFDGSSKVLTPEGYKRIDKLEAGEKIINYDEKNKLFKEDYIEKVHKNLKKSESEKMLELTMDNGAIIKVTENHEFMVQNIGWVKAKDLTYDMEILSNGADSMDINLL